LPASSSAKDYSSRSKSAQYDFSRFEPAKQSSANPKQKSNPSRKAQSQTQTLRVVITPARQRRMAENRAFAVHAVLSIIFLVGLAALMLYSRAILAAVNEDIGTQTELLSSLNGEYTRLQTELDAKISLRNIEEYASTNLGMSKVEQDQVQYVNVEQGESVTLYHSTGENSFVERLRQWFSEIFGHNQTDSEIG